MVVGRKKGPSGHQRNAGKDPKGLAASVTGSKTKDPTGHQRNAGEDPKGLEGVPSVVAEQATLTYKVPAGV